MGQREFDAQAASDIEAIFEIGDARRRRATVRAALAAAPGERVLDVGGGPGVGRAGLLAVVGEEG